jgi:hypothetical protein
VDTFEDFEHVPDDVLRQVAARVHVVDLAYALSSAGDELRERWLGSVRPGLRTELESLIRTVENDSVRYPDDSQVRNARARIVQVVRDARLL